MKSNETLQTLKQCIHRKRQEKRFFSITTMEGCITVNSVNNEKLEILCHYRTCVQLQFHTITDFWLFPELKKVLKGLYFFI